MRRYEAIDLQQGGGGVATRTGRRAGAGGGRRTLDVGWRVMDAVAVTSPTPGAFSSVEFRLSWSCPVAVHPRIPRHLIM